MRESFPAPVKPAFTPQLLSCLEEEGDTGSASKWWNRKYWSSSAPIKERWTLIIWCLISPVAIQRVCCRSFVTRRNSLRVAPSGSRRWWSGPGWDCAEPKTVRGHAGGYTCAKTSSSADPVTSLGWGKYVWLKVWGLKWVMCAWGCWCWAGSGKRPVISQLFLKGPLFLKFKWSSLSVCD